MRHSLEPEYRKYIKGYRFLSFARNFGNKIADKITSMGKPRSKKEKVKKHNRRNNIPPEKRKQIIKDLKLF